MALTYQQAPAAEALDLAVDILNETRKVAGTDRERCRWLYLDNPDGQATIWIAREAGEVAGFAALVPRRMRVDGDDRVAWNTADLSVRAPFRRRGIATALRTRAREAIDAGQVDLLYGNPNGKSEGAHRKAGYVALGEMRRWVRVIAAAPYAARVLPAPLARAVGRVVDPLLARGGASGRHEVERQAALRFDERFDELFAAAHVGRRVVGVRDHRYLAWRWGANPLDDLAVYTASDGRELRGYLVCRRRGDTVEILDIFPPEAEVAGDLVRAVIADAAAAGVARVDAGLLDDSPLAPILRRRGFVLRPGVSRMFAYASPEVPWREPVTRGRDWLAGDGDRDV